jgi:hypothetical protein
VTQYDNTNRWSVFFNDPEQRRKDTSPDFSGTLNVDGKEFFIDGWRKHTRVGKEFISGSIKAKTGAPAQRDTATARSSTPVKPGRLEDDIPFTMEWR